MESPIDSSGSETDSNKSFENFENPNFRKIYATLSVNTMMGCNNPQETSKLCEDVDGSGKQSMIDSSTGPKLAEYGEEKQDSSELPCGWEKHEDDNGPYYWHIPR